MISSVIRPKRRIFLHFTTTTYRSKSFRQSVNQDTNDDELDENNYSLDDLSPYTPTVEKHSSKLHDSSKTSSRSLSIICRKRKIEKLEKDTK